MTRRKPKKVATLKLVVDNERSRLGVYQGAQRFKRVEHKRVPVRLVEMKETDGETCAGGREHRPKTARLACVSEV